jgi:hypothetical protein
VSDARRRRDGRRTPISPCCIWVFIHETVCAGA